MNARVFPAMRRAYTDIDTHGPAGTTRCGWHASTVWALMRAGLVEHVPGSDGRLIRTCAPLPPLCELTDGCERKATTTHGNVPACQRCRQDACVRAAKARGWAA